MDLNEINCLVRAVQLGSLTKAAKSLGIPKSTVSRRISSLEARLKVTLLNRTTRTLSLTDAGSMYVERMAQALQEMSQAEAALQESQEQISGVVRVTAPVEFGLGAFMDLLDTFQKKHPAVSIELLLTERVVDLVNERIDVAVRIGELKDSSLLSKKVGAVTGKIIASREYLAAHGTPKTLEDLEKHRLLGFTPNGYHLSWDLEREKERRVLKVKAIFSSNNVIALKTAVLNHQGIAMLPLFLVHEEIAAKKVQVVLNDWRGYGAPVSIVFPGQKHVAPRTRSLIDFLGKELNAML